MYNTFYANNIFREAHMCKGLLTDARSIANRDPAARNTAEVFLLYPGFHALIWHRLTNCLYRHKLLFLARMFSQWAKFFTGIEIHPGATIGRGLFIDHGTGIVIGETAVIGDNCTIYHGVTLGGTGKDVGKRHPTIGNNVLIGAGAIILGPVVIGDNVMVGAGAIVLQSVPAHSTIVGSKARIVKSSDGRRPSEDLDQIHIPDPVAQEICKLRVKIEQLEKKIDEK
jgi:serine O-acetyltransferase